LIGDQRAIGRNQTNISSAAFVKSGRRATTADSPAPPPASPKRIPAPSIQILEEPRALRIADHHHPTTPGLEESFPVQHAIHPATAADRPPHTSAPPVEASFGSLTRPARSTHFGHSASDGSRRARTSQSATLGLSSRLTKDKRVLSIRLLAQAIAQLLENSSQSRKTHIGTRWRRQHT
jgi:hypothetical protein